MKHRAIYIICFTVVALLTASCGGSRKSVSPSRPADRNITIRERHKPQRHNGDPGFDVNHSLAERIVKSARKWLGTPYRYGGKDRKGTDCSGMTMSLYGEVAGVKLPRNSGAQYEYCVSIGRDDLQPGDLVFFCGKSGGPVSHVGLYVGDRRMIHASSSRGVMESSIDERYWQTHYYGSGRVDAVTYAVTGGRKHDKTRNKQPEPVNPQPQQFAADESRPVLPPAPQVETPALELPALDELPQEQHDAPSEAEQIEAEVKAAFGM